MNLLALTRVEFQKIKRSGILLILFAATVILWIPSILNADLNFTMASKGISISPEANYFIQGFLGMSWFMFPGSMVVSTVLLSQTERGNKGILKMLTMPISTVKFCLAKFLVLLALALSQVLMMTGMYYLSGAIASHTQGYNLLLPLTYVLKEAGIVYIASVPMLAVFWMLSVCIQTPIFSMGIGLGSIVPSVLAINTRVWFLYPMCYPFYVLAAEQSRLTGNGTVSVIESAPWISAAAAITVLCLVTACLRFGQAERK